MENQYKTWLQTLGRQRGDLPPCVRGLNVSHTLSFPGNVTSATLRGSIKASPDSPTELAVFTVGTPVFANDKTTWPLSLTANQTAALPADTAGDGVVTLIYDFLITLPGGFPTRVAAGLFPVSGFVTEPVQ
jgi:hypothetical protein